MASDLLWTESVLLHHCLCKVLVFWPGCIQEAFGYLLEAASAPPIKFCLCSSCPHAATSPRVTGRCASCGENVVGEGTGCTAMDQVFHVDCFVCMTCSTKLRGKPFFAVEKKAYCEPCYIVSSRSPPAFAPLSCHLRPLVFLWPPNSFIFFHNLSFKGKVDSVVLWG